MVHYKLTTRKEPLSKLVNLIRSEERVVQWIHKITHWSLEGRNKIEKKEKMS